MALSTFICSITVSFYDSSGCPFFKWLRVFEDTLVLYMLECLSINIFHTRVQWTVIMVQTELLWLLQLCDKHLQLGGCLAFIFKAIQLQKYYYLSLAKTSIVLTTEQCIFILNNYYWKLKYFHWPSLSMLALEMFIWRRSMLPLAVDLYQSSLIILW